MQLVNQLQFDPDQAIKWGIGILGNGAGNMMNTTVSAVGSIVNGLTTFFIAFSFACYILFEKEKLQQQMKKVVFAFVPGQKADAFLKICSLTYRTFASFLTGQCLEAVILGSMFVITLSLLRMPYALLIGVLIAFTALVPIFGAFIGFLLFPRPLHLARLPQFLANAVQLTLHPAVQFIGRSTDTQSNRGASHSHSV